MQLILLGFGEVLALAIAPGGFTVADLAARVSAMPGHDGYTIRNAAYDLRKLRGKHLADKPGRTRRYLIYPVPPASSAPCSPSGTRSSRRCWPASPTRVSAGLPATGPTSACTTRRSAWR